MKLIDHYIRLWSTFYKTDGEPVKLTREDAANTLGCSERNAVHVLNNLEEEGWMKRTKGRGRGNVTRATFLLGLTDAVDIYAARSAGHEDFKRFAELAEECGLLEQNEEVMERFFSNWFGAALENESETAETDHLHIPYFRTFFSLDPKVAARQSERHMIVHIFNTLFYWDERSRRVVPGIAHHIEADAEGREWMIYLRKHVCFHHGKTLSAEDVIFSLRRIAWLEPFLASAEAEEELTVKVKLTEPLFAFPVLLTSTSGAVVPDQLGGLSGSAFARTPIGTGPFMVKNHDEEHLELASHRRYFRERPHLEGVTIHFLQSYEKYIRMRKVGDQPLPYLPFHTGAGGVDRVRHAMRRGLSVKYLVWNMNHQSIRENKPFRKKVMALINREQLVDDLGYPRDRGAGSFFKNSRMADKLEVPQANVTQPDGKLILVTYDLKPHVEDAKWIAAACMDQGIDVEVRAVAYDMFSEEAAIGHLILAESPSDEAEEAMLWGLFTSNQLTGNLDQQTVISIAVRLSDAASRPELPERIGRLGRIEDLLITQGLVLPLYWTYQQAAFSSELMGVRLNAFGLVPFDELFFKKATGILV
ncbi:hypothetical protein CR205_02870 [Alteribacter lacisalsi]|uniref:ABC transporter substrate-binding protein n=1 Tax=Alteribacter lacisalsi TaxID=2045244 RepID=A0A2W0HJ65_9BACI|nr:ABC transporter substrate-binding protein [Alteribacter lacisalsi]PYZ97555.1 hypothetical protein CR205_02870 [Alteribacter lacisalsi]